MRPRAEFPQSFRVCGPAGGGDGSAQTVGKHSHAAPFDHTSGDACVRSPTSVVQF